MANLVTVEWALAYWKAKIRIGCLCGLILPHTGTLCLHFVLLSHAFGICQSQFLRGLEGALCVAGLVLVNISLRILSRHSSLIKTRVKGNYTSNPVRKAIDATRASQCGQGSCLIAQLPVLFPVRNSLTCFLNKHSRVRDLLFCACWDSLCCLACRRTPECIN